MRVEREEDRWGGLRGMYRLQDRNVAGKRESDREQEIKRE